LKPAEYLLYVFISNLKFYFFLKFEATTILTQGATALTGKGSSVAATKNTPTVLPQHRQKRQHQIRRDTSAATPEALKYMACGQMLRRGGNYGVGLSINGRKDTAGFRMI
jgi:hypothetical protein